MVGSRTFTVTFEIRFCRTNGAAAEADPSPAELESYVSGSKAIPQNPTYLLDDVSEMVYTGGTSFRFKCTWHGSAESLVKTIAAQCMEDGEWGAAPGNGSFVYPTRDGNKELGVLRYANVVAV